MAAIEGSETTTTVSPVAVPRPPAPSSPQPEPAKTSKKPTRPAIHGLARIPTLSLGSPGRARQPGRAGAGRPSSNSRRQTMQHAREGNGLAHVLEAADPSQGALHA